jgi:hypothetical protein
VLVALYLKIKLEKGTFKKGLNIECFEFKRFIIKIHYNSKNE